jgi:formylglycine-generating enzyme required for sulfatase activity
VSAALSSRAAKSLTTAEECGLKPKDVFKECDQCPEMMVIPAGSFLMGWNDKDDESNASPRHQVTISKPFAVGKFHVTVAQFADFVAETGHKTGECDDRSHATWRHPDFQQAGNHPVVCVSWNDALAYAAWLSKRTDKVYRLLSEAEWEYSARAGTTSRWFWGSNADDARSYAYETFYGDYPYTAPVGSRKPNMFGLYDMAGNANQIVLDCYNENYTGAPTDGSAWTTEPCQGGHVVRGGDSNSPEAWMRSAHRGSSVEPDERSSDNGFRVARTLSR